MFKKIIWVAKYLVLITFLCVCIYNSEAKTVEVLPVSCEKGVYVKGHFEQLRYLAWQSSRMELKLENGETTWAYAGQADMLNEYDGEIIAIVEKTTFGLGVVDYRVLQLRDSDNNVLYDYDMEETGLMDLDIPVDFVNY